MSGIDRLGSPGGLLRSPCLPGSRSPRIGAIAVILAWSLNASLLWAGTALVIDAPTGNQRAVSGIHVTVESIWVRGNGYRPVSVTIRRTMSTPAPERNFQVQVFVPFGYFGSSSGFRVTKHMTLPEDQRAVTDTLLVPQRSQWLGAILDVWEDGRELKDLTDVRIGVNAWQTFSEALPKILIIDGDAPMRSDRHSANLSGSAIQGAAGSGSLPDIRAVARIQLNAAGPSPRPQGNVTAPASGSISDRDILTQVSRLDDLELIPPEDAPTQWQGYTCLDFVFISQADLTAMAKDLPGRWRALADWIQSGGTLCISGTGPQYEGVDSLQTIFGPPVPDEGTPAHGGWTAPWTTEQKVEFLETLGNTAQWARAVPGGQAVVDVVTEQEQAAKPKAKRGPVTPDGRPLFLLRSWGLGTLVAFGPVEPFPGTQESWGYLLNQLGTERWSWYQRHGVSMSRENEEFWNFLIPGVGTAPVGAFRVLITLFILLIGPVNYLLLRRWQRLHWLLVTVPVGAIVVTFGLFAYALLSDGLASRVRVRSLTHVDQQQGRAVSWSRQTYYTGLAPSQGLVFPKDSAVYELDQFPTYGQGRSSAKSKRIHWDDSQRLQRGYISSRVTSQYMVVCARGSAAHVRVFDGPAGDRRLENRLGVDIQMVVVRDKAGDFFFAESVPMGKSKSMSRLESPQSRGKLIPMLAAAHPAYPKGFDPMDYRGAVGYIRPYRYRSWGVDYSLPAPAVSTSVMRTRFREMMNSPDLALSPGSYAAVVARPPEVSVGIAKAREVASLHVITGTW